MSKWMSLVTLRVQVHTLGCDVARDEHAQLRRGLAELLDDLLLLGVAEAAVQNTNLLVCELEVLLTCSRNQPRVATRSENTTARTSLPRPMPMFFR